MKKLNGWQRLWILVVCIYLLLVIFVSWSSFPQKSPILQDWAIAVLELEKRYDPSITNLDSWRIRFKYSEKGITDEQFIKKLKENSAQKSSQYKLDFQAIEKQYRKKMDDLYSKRIEHIGNSILFWVLPSIFLYFLGVAIGWVYKGFRSRDNG